MVLNVQDASIFGISDQHEDLGLFEKLKAAKTIAQILDNNNVIFQYSAKERRLGDNFYPNEPKIRRPPLLKMTTKSKSKKMKLICPTCGLKVQRGRT